MDGGTFDIIMKIIQVVIVPALLLFAAWVRAVAKENNDLKQRVSILETEFNTLPKNEAFHDLAMSMERMNGNLKEISAKLENSEKFSQRLMETVTRQEEYLLHSNRGK